MEGFALKGRGAFVENRAWKSGSELLEKARAAGVAMPVILSDAAFNSAPLPLWGMLRKLDLDGERTTVRLVDIQRVRGNHVRQDLTLKNTGKLIKDNYIRPYAICHTPPWSCT